MLVHELGKVEPILRRKILRDYRLAPGDRKSLRGILTKGEALFADDPGAPAYAGTDKGGVAVRMNLQDFGQVSAKSTRNEAASLVQDYLQIIAA
jgi:hypothetical protein